MAEIWTTIETDAAHDIMSRISRILCALDDADCGCSEWCDCINYMQDEIVSALNDANSLLLSLCRPLSSPLLGPGLMRIGHNVVRDLNDKDYDRGWK